MENQSIGVFEYLFDLNLLTSTKSLQISNYSSDRNQEAVSEAKLKWQQFQTKIEDLKRKLSEFILQKIEKERIHKFSEAVSCFLKEQVAQTAQDYHMLASLETAFQENESLLNCSNVMKEISCLIKEWYSGLNSNLLAIPAGGLQNRIFLDIKPALSSLQKDPDESIFLLESKELAQAVKMSNKRISITELDALLNSFAEFVLSTYQKKAAALVLYVRGATETACKDLFEYVSAFISRILSKLNALENDSTLDPAVRQILSQSVDEFFFNAYNVELSFLERKLQEILNEQALQRIDQGVVEKALSNISPDKELKVTKTKLGDYFFKAKAAIIKQKVPPTCLKLIQELNGVRNITVVDAGQHQKKLAQERAPLLIKYNRVYLAAFDESDPDCREGATETILYTTKEEIVKGLQRIEIKLRFLPPNLEFPKEETMIIFFLVKLLKYVLSRPDSNEPINLDQSRVIDIGIGEFLAFSVYFIAEHLLAKINKDRKSVVLGHDTNSFRSPEINDKSPNALTDRLNGNAESIVLKNDLPYEETKFSDDLQSAPLSLENIDNVESTDMAETDIDWELSDTKVFLKLLEQDKCKLLNDLRTLKMISALNDYVYIDKPTSSDIFNEYLTSLTNNSKDLRSPSLEKILSCCNIELIRGIILLFAPLPDYFNLVALRIDFDTKNRNYFALETRNIDLIPLKSLFKGLGKLVKRAVLTKNVVKTKIAKFKDNHLFIKLNIEENIGLQCFNNFYFPYTYTLRLDLNSSSTEILSVEQLKALLSNYLQAAYGSQDGIERMRNLLQVYHLYTNRFTNIFIIEEFNDLDRIYGKIKQYLRLCFVDSIEETAHKMKSILIFGRIRNEKLRTYDFILIFFEYTFPNQIEKEKGEQAHDSNRLGQQSFHVFGDAYLHLVQVRGVIKSFFKEKQMALPRLRLEFYQMKKAKTDTNLLFFDHSLFSCILFILLNEKIPIADIVCICRLCPAIQYRYLNATFEKNRSTQYITNRIPKKFDLDVKTLKIIGRQNMELVDEIFNAIMILQINQPGSLKWLVELKSGPEIKNIITPMIPSGKNDGAFKVNLKDLPKEPFNLITVNYDFNASNPNVCNIIQADGSIFVLTAVPQGSPIEQKKPNKNQVNAVKSIETIRKSLPKFKAGYKYNVTHHEMHLKNLTFDNVKMLFDFIVIFYLVQYRSYKDPWFLVSENSILSLIFVDLRICFHSSPDCYNVVRSLHENHFLLLEHILIQRVHKNYTDDNLISLFGVFFANRSTRCLVFCIQNDMEHSFHMVIKELQKNLVKVLVTTIKDQTLGHNAKNFYDEMLSSLQDGVFSEELKCEFVRFELEALPSFFHSIDPNLMSIALATAAQILDGQDYFKTIQKYLQTWYQPTILSSQFKVIAKSF